MSEDLNRPVAPPWPLPPMSRGEFTEIRHVWRIEMDRLRDEAEHQLHVITEEVYSRWNVSAEVVTALLDHGARIGIVVRPRDKTKPARTFIRYPQGFDVRSLDLCVMEALNGQT